nr:hypothetical protein BaRGS_032226 [Batillaria attramentaria]
MFRWLKDRKKSRKPSSNGSVRSKEDDYGFKQKHSEWKRDLPPTPFDSASSHSSFTDDDKSFHIYEEIPDLPFSQGASTPSCDDSSVFSTPLGLEGRCAGLGGGDISDRLLSAINLTRLLAAVTSLQKWKNLL